MDNEEKLKIYLIFPPTYPVVIQYARDVILVLRCPCQWVEASFPYSFREELTAIVASKARTDWLRQSPRAS